MTYKRLSEVNEDDYGRSVTFPRPASYDSGRRSFTGKLIRVSKQPNPMGRAEYTIVIDYGGPAYLRDSETFGPLPGNYPIDVRHLWREREPETHMIKAPCNAIPARGNNPFIPPTT